MSQSVDIKIIHPKITVEIYNKIFSITNLPPSIGMSKALETLLENYEKFQQGVKSS